MNIREYILVFVCLAIGAFAIYSGFNIELLNNDSYHLTKGKVTKIIRYGSKTEYYIEDSGNVVYQTNSLTNPFLNSSNKSPFENHEVYEIGYRKFDSWKQKNDKGYLRREIIILRKKR